MQLLEGRDFNAFSFDADSDKVIINLAAKELMQLKESTWQYFNRKRRSKTGGNWGSRKFDYGKSL